MFSGHHLAETYNTFHYVQPRGGANRPAIRIKHTASIDDFMQAVAVRASVYMSEQSCPYNEEFDGNDFASGHLIAYSDDEPAACLRIRYFGDFAKLERLAVRKEYRRSRIAFLIVRAGIDLCIRKGYRHIYGHARVELINFWARFGAKLIPERPVFEFSGEKYREMMLEVTGDVANRLTLQSDALVLIRPEGMWDEPGILETSTKHSSPER